MTRHSSLLIAACLTTVLIAGCVSSAGTSLPTSTASATAPASPAGQKTVDVSLEGMAFVNDTVSLNVGDAILWTHRDGPLMSHAIMTDEGDPESFASHPACMPPGVPAKAVCMTGGDTYAHSFATPGSFGIHCHVHSSMHMVVTVLKPASAAAS